MDIVIREYRDADYEACQSLYRELSEYHAEIFEDPTIADEDTNQWLEGLKKINKTFATWVAEVDERVVGLANLMANDEGGQIEPIVVSSSFRHSGIGTRLIEHLVEEAKKLGIRFLSIRPVLRNEKAFDLYVRLGFDKAGEIQLFQDLAAISTKKWKSGLRIHNRELNY